MSKLHIKHIDHKNFVPKEGQRDGLMCSNKKSITRCPSFGTTELKEEIFSEKELENISELCFVFKKIRGRLISEGYSIEYLRKKLYESKAQ